VRARTVIHTTNRWASHLRPEFEKLILPEKGTVAAIKAPAGFIKRTGAQHWDSSINVSRAIPFSSSKLVSFANKIVRTTTTKCHLHTTPSCSAAGGLTSPIALSSAC
jgi:hypothetical protein